MLEHKNSADYVNIGTLFSDEQISVSIAFQGENTLENQFIVNRFPNNKHNNYLFEKIFSYYSKDSRTKDFCNFFTFEDSFFCVFKYTKCENIKIKYNKQLCVSYFEERCNILERILMKIESLSDFPLDALVSVTRPENICVDHNKNIHFVYNLKDIFKNKNCTISDLYNNIHDIIYIMLQKEAEAKYNKALHIVLDKCKNNTYTSLPQLIVELKQAERISQNSTWFSYIKSQIAIHQPQITKYSKNGIMALIVASLVYIAYNTITKNTGISLTSPAVSIGEVTYNGDSTDESEKSISNSSESGVIKASSVSDINLSEGLDLDYEDYIVQNNDTVESIASEYYQDASYTNAVATFNGIDKDKNLTAGEILKLPNRTAIALYLSN